MIAGRIPHEVELSIRKLMATYAGNITSILCQFPSQQVGLEFCWLSAFQVQASLISVRILNVLNCSNHYTWSVNIVNCCASSFSVLSDSKVDSLHEMLKFL